MQSLTLAGSDWTLHEYDGSRTWPATVPGCVHTDLLAAEAIPDPWYRDNEKDIHWVCEKDWLYSREFVVEADLLERDHVTLCCDGLDTFAKVMINGKEALAADNMFRFWRVDVKHLLKAGENKIEVLFRSPLPYMKQRDSERRLPGWNIFHEDFYGKSYVRKMGCAFGWDWGVMAPTAGIWRDIRLEAWDARLDDVKITQQHSAAGSENNQVALNVRTTTQGLADAKSKLRATLQFEGQTVASSEADAPATPGEAAGLKLDVPDVQLWWPNGLGDQPLYDCTVELLDEAGQTIDTRTLTIGLRDLQLIREPDEFGESFRFRCNGVDFFGKGANWIPCDVWPSRISRETYDDLLGSAAEANMNMIRLWGGGLYEQPAFYEACDRLGLLIWHDFMFSCSTYPWWDEAFLESARLEAIDNVRQVRHHPSLALWCGNNEIEQGMPGWEQQAPDYIDWDGYKVLFDDVLAKVVAEEDSVTPYWPSSGHTPEGDGRDRADHRDPTAGDAHAWSVWFGGQPFEAQRDWVFRFMSEFGFQSFPEPRTIESFTLPEDRDLSSWVMDYHQRSGPGNQTIFKYLLEWFPMPRDFEQLTWLSQLTQAICVQYAAEHARRIQGRMDGLMYWQLNDLWPGATWSSVDVFGRWKALQHFARRFFAPVLVSLVEDAGKGTVDIHVSNQTREMKQATLHWQVTNCAGEVLEAGAQGVEVAGQCNTPVATLECQALREAGGKAKLPLEIRGHPNAPLAGDREVMVWAWLADEAGAELSRNLALFARPKYLKLSRPTFEVEVEEVAGGEDSSDSSFVFRATIKSDVASPWTRLELTGHDARFSDNFFHVQPNLPMAVEIRPGEKMSLEQVREALKVVPLLSYGATGDMHA